MSTPSPERIKAFLDDLALISAKHDMIITAKEWVEFHDGATSGYSYSPRRRELDPTTDWFSDEPDGISSIDASTVSAHQRVALAKSLRDTAASAALGPDIPSETRGADAMTDQPVRTCKTIEPRNFLSRVGA